MLTKLARTGVHRPVGRNLKSHVTTHPTKCLRLALCKSKFGDELLDFVTAGPKMRKWYGGDRALLASEEQEPEPDEPEAISDTVLVMEADSPIGEQVALQLILARQQLRLLVRDVAAAKVAYGPYATAVPADAAAAVPVSPRLLRGVKCLVLLGSLKRATAVHAG
ncbi:hypothetical protein Agub_g10655, partial [Astrephomene gubernaculifera]